MNEEELFCKLFPEYVVNGKPLSPYFDLFESGYEQSENRIEQLEEEGKKSFNDWLKACDKYGEVNLKLEKAKEIISEWEDSFCCGADYLYLGNKGKELRIKSQNFLNNTL